MEEIPSNVTPFSTSALSFKYEIKIGKHENFCLNYQTYKTCSGFFRMKYNSKFLITFKTLTI